MLSSKLRGAVRDAALLLVLCGATQNSAQAAERAPSVARGKQLYLTIGCVRCHGSVGQGSGSGTRLVPDPLPADALAQFIRSTTTTMPAYSASVLGDADVADIAAFLASLPAPRSADDIPLLRKLKR